MTLSWTIKSLHRVTHHEAKWLMRRLPVGWRLCVCVCVFVWVCTYVCLRDKGGTFYQNPQLIYSKPLLLKDEHWYAHARTHVYPGRAALKQLSRVMVEFKRGLWVVTPTTSLKHHHLSILHTAFLMVPCLASAEYFYLTEKNTTDISFFKSQFLHFQFTWQKR